MKNNTKKCVAITQRNYVDDFFNIIENMNKRYRELKKQKNDLELKQDGYVHFLKLGKYDAVTGSKELKHLREVSKNLDEIEKECMPLVETLNRLNNAGFIPKKIIDELIEMENNDE